MYLKQLLIRHHRLAALLVFLLVLFLVAQATGLRSLVSPQYLQQTLQENPWQGLALFVLLFALGNVVQVPGWIFLAAAVYAFGRTTGGLVTYVAASLSCMFTFVMIRMIGGNVASTITNRHAVRLLAQLNAHPIRNVVILRTLFQTLPALNYALALTGIGFRKYAIGTLLGLPLPIALYCVFFDYLVTLAHRA